MECLQYRFLPSQCTSGQVHRHQVQVKARSNEHNMLHATSSNIVACKMLHHLNTLLHDVERCCIKFEPHQTSCNIIQQRARQGVQTMQHVVCNNVGRLAFSNGVHPFKSSQRAAGNKYLFYSPSQESQHPIFFQPGARGQQEFFPERGFNFAQWKKKEHFPGKAETRIFNRLL